MKFKLYWLDDTTTIVEGATISQAFTNAGFGAGALKALDYYDILEGDTIVIPEDNKDTE